VAVTWGEWWKVLPDYERQQWTLDPFVSVGPLRFDMSPREVSQALGSVTGDPQLRPHRPYTGEAVSGITVEVYRESGLHLYYREERLDGVVVNARLGPQVLADGVALVGQVPSVLEQWMLDRAEARQDDFECEYMDPGIPGSNSLGVWIDVQRAGDHLLTRPVFVSCETADNITWRLPSHAWSACNPY
jgi:hypothetical protein